MSVDSDIAELQSLRSRVAQMLSWPDAQLFRRVESVSKWSIAQQLHHTGLVFAGVSERIATLHENADPSAASGRPKLPGYAVLLLGRIPRGRAQSPEAVRPDPEPARAMLTDLWAEGDRRFDIVRGLAPTLHRARARAPHPMLGSFTAAQWLRFLRVHTAHHLEIVDDLQRS